MLKIKVLIVDDSYFMRKLLRELFSDVDDIEIIGEAKNGPDAIRMAAELEPDVITMDYNMPEMNGSEATAAIMRSEKHLPAIIMLSAATKNGAESTLDCLKAGAFDFIQKPSGELSFDIEKVKEELLDKVRIGAKARLRRHRDSGRRVEIKKIKRTKQEGAPQLIVVGSSTGGPPAVEEIISHLPADLKVAILIVQHMPEKFTKTFAERLNKLGAFKTKEAEEGDVISIGQCLVAPGDYHMEVRVREGNFERYIHLTKEVPLHGLRPAIDITMKTVANNFSGGIMGIILTGMGVDGTDGMRAIFDRGGYTIAQDPVTAVIDSMPSSVIKNDLAKEVVPLDQIASRIVQLSGR